MQDPAVQTVSADRPVTRLVWIAQLAAAAILAQAAVFKLSGAPEAVKMFETLGAGAAGRLGLGAVELGVAGLLLVPRSAALGGLIAAGLMVGAIGSHLTVLGIELDGDGGAMFGMAVATFVAGAVTAFLRRRQLPLIGGRF